MLEHKLDVNRLEETRTQLKFVPFEEVARIPTGQHIIPEYICLDSTGFYEVDCQEKKLLLDGNCVSLFSDPLSNT